MEVEENHPGLTELVAAVHAASPYLFLLFSHYFRRDKIFAGAFSSHFRRAFRRDKTIRGGIFSFIIIMVV